MKVLILADIVGRIGREATKLVLPKLIALHKPSLVIANCENLAHGSGITTKTIREMLDAGIDVLTGGNHMWRRESYVEVFADKELEPHIVRPLNETKFVPGDGMKIIEKDGFKFAVVNVMGRVFFKEDYINPLEALDEVFEKIPDDAISIIDVHAEATSERAVIGLYMDGRASAVTGSHTHVPTADERILPKGTAFITDIGMVGAHNESIGVSYESVLPSFIGKKASFQPPETGPAEVNAVVITFKNGEKMPSDIKRIREIVEIG